MLDSFAEAASFGELIVISTFWGGTENAINLAISSNFNDKIVVDTTNPLEFAEDSPPKLSLGYVKQLLVRESNPCSQIQKLEQAFNIVGNPHMIHPDFPGGPPTMFICGNFKDAKDTIIEELLTPFGWETIDIGGIEQSRLLEPLAMLWITHYLQTGLGNHAFKLLKK